MADARHQRARAKGAIFTGFGKRTAAVRHASPKWVIWHKTLPYRLVRCRPRQEPTAANESPPL